MDRATADKILDAQERFFNAPEYQALWAELQVRNEQFLSLMAELPPQQRSIVEDYMGLVIEMQLSLLGYALEEA